MSDEYLITLVHGTFAENAPWVQRDSRFRSKFLLKFNEVGIHKIDFVEFNWSGKNSNFARLQASKELAVCLENQCLYDVSKKKVIVAHSHGGNVALYALKALGEKQHKFDLVTLSIPFLYVKKKQFIENLEENIKILQFYINGLMALAFLGLFSLFAYLFSQTFALIFGLVGALSMPFSVLALDTVYRNMNDRIVSRVGDGINETVKYMSYQSTGFPNTLVLVHRLDEVRIWFNSIKKVWKAIFSLDLLMQYGKLVAFCGIGINFFLITISFFVPPFQTFFINYILPLDIICLFIVLASPLYSLLTLVLLLISKSNAITLGKQPWYETLFIDIQPSHKLMNCDQIRYKEYSHKMKSALNHSLYEDDIIIADVCSWLKSKC